MSTGEEAASISGRRPADTRHTWHYTPNTTHMNMNAKLLHVFTYMETYGTVCLCPRFVKFRFILGWCFYGFFFDFLCGFSKGFFFCFFLFFVGFLRGFFGVFSSGFFGFFFWGFFWVFFGYFV